MTTISRRSFIAALAALGASSVLGVSGCGASNRSAANYDDLHSSGYSAGFEIDTEVPEGAATIVGYVDEYLKRVKATSGEPILKFLVGDYNANDGRGQITFDFRYVSAETLDEYAANGCDGDFMIAQDDTITAGIEAGVLFGGIADSSVRTLIPLNNSTTMYVVRKEGSTTELPPADTYNGEEIVQASDGVIKTQLGELAKFDGTMGVLPESTNEGIWARSSLERVGLYSEASGTGGSFDESVSSIIVEYESVAALNKAIRTGECDLGFLFGWDIEDGVERYYEPLMGSVRAMSFKGASVVGAENPGTARDFLQFVMQHQ